MVLVRQKDDIVDAVLQPSLTDQAGSKLAELYGRPGFKIRRAHQTAVATFSDAVGFLAVTTSQYGVIHTLAHTQDLDQMTVARMVGLDRATTGFVLNNLEQQGFLSRVPYEKDKRHRILRLTDQGHALYAALRQPATEAVTRLLTPVPIQNREPFLDLLERLVETHTPDAEPATLPAMKELYRRPGYLIRRAHQISSALFTEECRPTNITPTQFGVLFILKHFPEVDQITVARLGSFDRSTNATVLALLEERQLIERRVHHGDRRRRLLYLSDEGNRILSEIAVSTQNARHRLVGHFTGDEQAFLLRCLDRIIAAK
jgi:DNA-binding MarR family transcriptional regulator